MLNRGSFICLKKTESAVLKSDMMCHCLFMSILCDGSHLVEQPARSGQGVLHTLIILLKVQSGSKTVISIDFRVCGQWYKNKVLNYENLCWIHIKESIHQRIQYAYQRIQLIHLIEHVLYNVYIKKSRTNPCNRTLNHGIIHNRRVLGRFFL